MKPRYPHEQYMDFIAERLPQYRHEALERQKQADTFVVWVVGLSSGAVALILSRSSVPSLVAPLALRIAVGCSLLTILFAVVFRAASYALGQLEWELTAGLEGFCSGYRSDRCGPIEITEQHTVEDIAQSLKEGMGLDYDNWLGKNYLTRDFWVDHYNRWAEFWRTQEWEGIRLLAAALAPVVGKSPEEIEKLVREGNRTPRLSRRAVKFRWVCSVSYMLMMVFFVLLVAALAIGFFAR